MTADGAYDSTVIYETVAERHPQAAGYHSAQVDRRKVLKLINRDPGVARPAPGDAGYFNRSRMRSSPAFAHASSRLPPGAPAAPIAPISSSPSLIGTPPPTRIKCGS